MIVSIYRITCYVFGERLVSMFFFYLCNVLVNACVIVFYFLFVQ